MARTEGYDKIGEFLYLVQALAIAAFARSKEDLTQMAAVLAIANAASHELPGDQPALSSALEFCGVYLPGFTNGSDRDGPRPSWLEPFRPAKYGPTEEFVDGKWQPENSRWLGLPGDRSADLNIMASLREKPDQEIADLVRADCGSARSIQARLSRLEREGFVIKSSSKPHRWVLSPNLPA
ncbi:hypothetical protein [Shinella sp.]|uniref:hypothetical protein n=1 Tax=Shinella sp. TaxID=1870904 RepID=UPI003F707617